MWSEKLRLQFCRVQVTVIRHLYQIYTGDYDPAPHQLSNTEHLWCPVEAMACHLRGGGENKFVCVFLYSEKIRKTKFSFTQALVFRYAGFQYRLGKFLRMKTLNTMHTSSVRSELQRDNFREALTVCSSLLPSNPAPSLPFFSFLSSHINPIILFLCSNAIKMW